MFSKISEKFLEKWNRLGIAGKIAVGVVAGFLLLALVFTVSQFLGSNESPPGLSKDEKREKTKIEQNVNQGLSNISNLSLQANAAREELTNQKLEAAEARGEINSTKKEVEKHNEEVNQTATNSNISGDAYNRSLDARPVNVSRSELKQKRCQAFPDSCK